MDANAVILLLLTFGGLSEAIRCYQCTGEHYSCSEEYQQEVECNATVKGCTVEKKTGPAPHMLKYCAMDNDLSELACVQGKTGQSGDCVKGTEQEIIQYYRECSADPEDINSLMLKYTVQVRKRSAFNVKQNEAMMSICVCRTSLCNTDDLEDGDQESPSTEPTNPTNATTAPTKTTESNTTSSNPTNGTSATTTTTTITTTTTDATTTPNTPTTTLRNTTPTNPTSLPDSSTSTTHANVSSASTNTDSGNTLPATTPKSSGSRIVNVGAVTASVIIFLLTN